ncbi:FKBP-type peptidyl-prolyl cis-trans isomerase [Haloparvum sp. AD34]
MTVDRGDRVRLDYVGRFEDGSVFATTKEAVAAEHDLIEAGDGERSGFSPLTFTVGRGEVIEGLDEGVVGLAAGEEATITVPPEAAYGEVDETKRREYDPEAFEAMVGQPPEIGLHVEAQNDLHGNVTAITDDAVAVDFNHELAGKTLVFDVRVLDVAEVGNH